jgi:hypothetical protein
MGEIGRCPADVTVGAVKLNHQFIEILMERLVTLPAAEPANSKEVLIVEPATAALEAGL